MTQRVASNLPETWEQSLFALWDVVTQAREKQGRSVADQIAHMALEAVREYIRKTPVSGEGATGE